VLFVPTNNALPPQKADVVHDARRVDIALARENGVWVVRADVAGRADGRVSYGSSAIVAPDGRVLRTAQRLAEDLLVAEIGIENGLKAEPLFPLDDATQRGR
jgi:predicted amidohydrolase